MRKTKNITLFAVIVISGIFNLAAAQVTEAEGTLKKQAFDTVAGWKTGGVTNLAFSQTSLTNWAAGGEDFTMSANGLFSVFANYKKKNMAWDNSLDIGYGRLWQGKGDEAINKKTDDKIDFLSKYGQLAFKNVYYAGMVNFKTQMDEGYNYPNDSVAISKFLAPAYLTVAIGLDYKPNSYFSAFAAPLTGKVTFVTDEVLSNAGAFGVDSGKVSKKEFGGYIRMIYSKNDFKNEFLKNIAFTTKVDLFSNYLKNPDCIDISWETQIAMKVNKYISVNLNTHLLYDDDIRFDVVENNVTKKTPKVQFKEILGIGFSYKF
ncbi:MAG: DUF3078 domain-containing protein [Bacteroidales bacterium]|nr:DUF3078 domain-containing protein [Bacteroidales bacterium]